MLPARHYVPLTRVQNFLFSPEGHIRLSDFGLAYVFRAPPSHASAHAHPARTCTGRTTPRVRRRAPRLRAALMPRADYEQQRRDLLHKHGIDLDEAAGPDARTRRMDRRDVAALMGGDGQSGVFTWREKHRRKVRTAPARARPCPPLTPRSLHTPCQSRLALPPSVLLTFTSSRRRCGTNSYSA
jgi:hypothetical protein